MTETYLYYNGKLLETFSGENIEKAIMADIYLRLDLTKQPGK